MGSAVRNVRECCLSPPPPLKTWSWHGSPSWVHNTNEQSSQIFAAMMHQCLVVSAWIMKKCTSLLVALINKLRQANFSCSSVLTYPWTRSSPSNITLYFSSLLHMDLFRWMTRLIEHTVFTRSFIKFYWFWYWEIGIGRSQTGLSVSHRSLLPNHVLHIWKKSTTQKVRLLQMCPFKNNHGLMSILWYRWPSDRSWFPVSWLVLRLTIY